MTPIVAIIGRPNTGKSTLFNYLTGEKKAITAREAGTTRDRIFGRVNFESDEGVIHSMLVDTGGIELTKDGLIETQMLLQAKTAIHDAHLIIFLVNSREELTQSDYDASQIVRKSGVPVILVASKCDSHLTETGHLTELGFGVPVNISCFHGIGIDELETEIFNKLKKKFPPVPHPEEPEEKLSGEVSDTIKIAFVGRPNVGKSSLLNAFFDEEKVIVSEIPGTTRDATDFEFVYDEQKFVLIDTAGIRKSGRIEVGLEKFSVARSLGAIEKADIAVLLIDAVEGITHQDMHIADYVLQNKTGMIIAVNKSDLMEKGEEIRNEWISKLRYKFDFTPWASVVFISAKNKKNINNILDIARNVFDQRQKRIPTSELNNFLRDINIQHPPSGTGSGKPKAFYFTQVGINPPHFILFVNKEENFHFSYYRYLENRMREKYGFEGTPIKIQVRSKLS